MPNESNLIFQYGSLIVDRSRFLCMNSGRQVPLSNIELAILELLMKYNGQVLTRERIATQIWENRQLSNYRVIDTHISNIKKALSDTQGEYIRGIRGLGYKFNVLPPQRVKITVQNSKEKT